MYHIRYPTFGLLLIIAVISNTTFVDCDQVNVWRNTTLKNNYPGALDGSSALYVNSWMYLFYGYNETIVASGIGQSTNVFSDDVYMIHPESGQSILLETEGTKPSERSFTATFWNSDRKNPVVYLYGGLLYALAQSPPAIYFYNDMYSLDLKTQQWSHIQTQNTPSRRGLFAQTRIGNKLVIHGGVYFAENFSGTTNFQDLLMYDPVLNIWIQLPQLNDVPSPRHNHGLHYWEKEHKLVSFGGTFAVNPAQYIYYTDFYDYDLNTNVWTYHNVSIGPMFNFTSLKQPVTFLVGDKYYIIGGDYGTGDPSMNDKTIVYDLITRQVEVLTTEGPHLKRATGDVDNDNDNYGTIRVLGGYDFISGSQVRFDKVFSLKVPRN
jgi:N-acetylneuraminic acid mutarotase